MRAGVHIAGRMAGANAAWAGRRGCASGAILLGAVAAAALAASAHAEEPYQNLAQELANPVANLISVPFQNNFDFGGGRGNAFRYTLNFQPVVPFGLSQDWNLITRTIVPFAHVERVFPDHRTGLGDVLQSFFLSPARPTAGGFVWGAGPVFLYPTATERGLGARQWGAGPTGVVLQVNGPWLYGVLANHVWGLGDGGPERSRVNNSFVQPFAVYTFPTQTGVSLNAEVSYDWDRRQATIPVNLGVSQLALVGTQPGAVRRWASLLRRWSLGRTRLGRPAQRHPGVPAMIRQGRAPAPRACKGSGAGARRRDHRIQPTGHRGSSP
jgi:hypothetical protein